jgi:hypothetical protein
MGDRSSGHSNSDIHADGYGYGYHNCDSNRYGHCNCDSHSNRNGYYNSNCDTAAYSNPKA